MVHHLKTWPEYFKPVVQGIKLFEIRKNDRPYAIGDILHLQEFEPIKATYTGNELIMQITYILKELPFIPIGYVA
jgi:hypothetical protein